MWLVQQMLVPFFLVLFLNEKRIRINYFRLENYEAFLEG
jgi:hypothetical protein